MKALAGNDAGQLKTWKLAYAWAKERASDHLVSDRSGPDGKVRERRLMEDYNPNDARDYDDETLREMLDWFEFARMQYLGYDGRVGRD
jgi:hypothetical protein